MSVFANATSIFNCGVLSQPGATYTLESDIINSDAWRCLFINVSHVTLDCQNHIIDGDGIENGDAIFLQNVSYITIKNCIITDWQTGISLYFNTITHTTFENNKLFNNFFGISSINTYIDSSYITLTNNIANNNYWGIYCTNFNYSNLISNTANNNNGTGILVNGYGNNIENNIANSNDMYGISLASGSTHNVLINNIAENNRYCGIELYYDYNNKDNTLESNRVNNNRGSGMCIQGNNHKIISNRVNNNNGSGISLYGYKNTLENNIASNNSDYGISIPFGSNHTLINNIADNNFRGISASSAKNVTLIGNRACGNSYRDFDVTILYGYGNHGENNRCNTFYGWNDTGAYGCKYRCKTIKLLIIPVNWQGSYTNFKAEAEQIAQYFLERIPLNDCPGRFEPLIPKEEDYGADWVGWNCTDPNIIPPNCDDSGTLTIIDRCASQYKSKTGQDYDFIAGITDIDLNVWNRTGLPVMPNCDNSVAGWSDGQGGLPVVIAESSFSGIVTHELGHEFGLSDEYCDCDGTPYASYCGPTARNNPLRTNLGCNTSTCCWNYGSGPYDSACGWCHGNYDRLGIDTNNDTILDSGQRSTMSNKILYGETGHYDINGYGHLKTVPQLQCNNTKALMLDSLYTTSSSGTYSFLTVNLMVFNNDTVIPMNISVGFGSTPIIYPEPDDYLLRVSDQYNNTLYSRNISLDFILFSDPSILINYSYIYDKIPFENSMTNLELYHGYNRIFLQDLEFCNNNGICDENENYYSCSPDCLPYEKDGICNNAFEGGCDPDCLPGYDPDCSEIVNIFLNQGWNLFSPMLVQIDRSTDRNISLRKGWNLFGYSSFTPFYWLNAAVSNGTETKSAALSDWIQLTLYYYNSSTGTYEFVPEDDYFLRKNKGYWLYAFEDDITLTLPNAGGSLIGNSFDWQNVNVNDGTETKTLEQAQQSGWLQATIYYFDENTQYYKFIPGDNNYIYPWRGYWLYSNKGNLTLTVS